MSLKKLINNREIRSFRLRFRMLLLSCFLKNKESLGLFMFSDTLQPKDREEIAEQFNKRKIKVNSLAKSIVKSIFLTKGWYNIRKLFEGGVVLVKNKENEVMSKDNIKYVLSDKRFFFRLFFWEQRFSRTSFIGDWLKIKDNKKTWICFFNVLRSKLKLLLYYTNKLKRKENA